MPVEHELYRAVQRLNELQWANLLRMADLEDDRPPIMRGESGYIDDGPKWVRTHVSSLKTLLPRFVNDENLATILFSDEILELRQKQPGPQAQLVFEPLDGPLQAGTTDMRLDILTAAGATFFQLYADITGPAALLQSPYPPPEVRVEKGSVQFSFGGSSLLISGVSLVIACSVGLVASPFAMVGGLGLATIGLVDQVINWRKTLTDTRAAESAISKTELERRKLELEIREKELELRENSLAMGPRPRREIATENEREIQALREMMHRLETEAVPPARLVPYEQVQEAASHEGISLGLAHHLLNRALPGFVTLKPFFQRIRIIKGDVTGVHARKSTRRIRL